MPAPQKLMAEAVQIVRLTYRLTYYLTHYLIRDSNSLYLLIATTS